MKTINDDDIAHILPYILGRNMVFKSKQGNRIYYSNLATNSKLSINVSEFIHIRCKVWAFAKGYKLLDECNSIVVTNLRDMELHIEDDDFDTPYVMQRIAKACQWIIKVNNL